MQRLTNEPNVLTEQKATRSSSCNLISYPWENQQLPTSSLQTYCSSYGLTVGNNVNFLGRNISNQGNYYEISLASTYTVHSRTVEGSRHAHLQRLTSMTWNKDNIDRC